MTLTASLIGTWVFGIIFLLGEVILEVRTRTQARDYQRLCGDDDSQIEQQVACAVIPRFETYRDRTLGLDDGY